MSKIKQILPSLREKKRYLAFKVESKEKMTKKQVEKGINLAILNYIGQLGYAKAGPILVDYNKNKGVLRINNRQLNNVRASLSLVKKINNKKAFISSITTSGLLNKARKAIKEG